MGHLTEPHHLLSHITWGSGLVPGNSWALLANLDTECCITKSTQMLDSRIYSPWLGPQDSVYLTSGA